MGERGILLGMERQQKASARFLWTGTLVMLVLAGPVTALASHQPNHTENPGGAAAITENNDSDGVLNNIPDEGDNLHPSGKDRSVEPGGSGDQGRSASTPDQDGRGPERDNGGTDKPNGPGGADILDQDRNNGCGNDDDFDDDNEGWCGKRVKPASNGTAEDQDKSKGADKPDDQDEVPPLGIVVGQGPGSQPGAGGTPGGVAPVAGQPGTQPPGQVLGEVVVQGVSAGTGVLSASEEQGSAVGALAATGAPLPLVAAVVFALVLLLAGAGLTTAGRSRIRTSVDSRNQSGFGTA
jgi:hypothetical protein